ncbi:choice-of-anchor P family protein [Frankia sp. R43]|uniref:choice-of-anchor P family protein n=1 Tax=Frankia sp. R43 TaxID=269536 RepID=UPI000AB79013|nr:choice-of-anchor P family protein [Frankia sp. R43]
MREVQVRCRGGRFRLARSVSGIVAAAVAGGTIVLTGGSATAASPPAMYDQLAYSTQVTVGGVIDSGATFPEGLGCTTASGVSRSNGGAVSIPALSLNAGASTNTVSTLAVGPVQTGTSTSQLLGLSLLGTPLLPLISADAIDITTTATSAADGTVTSTGSVTVTDLKLSGITILNGAVAPNTGIAIPGVGSLVVNRQIPVPGNIGLVTIGLSLDITLGPLAGTSITVGYAHSFFRPPLPVIISGVAYSNLVSAGPLTVGPLAATGVPCTGGTSTDTSLGITIPGVITVGAITETGEATVGSPDSSGSTTSTIAGVSLLGGLVTAGAITAKANVSYDGSTSTFDSTGTSIADLAIAGVPYVGPLDPGTEIPIPGVGVLFVNRQISDATSLSVRALELVLTGPVLYPGGTLPTYSVLQAGVANIYAVADEPIGLSAQVDQIDLLNKVCSEQEDAVACLT